MSKELSYDPTFKNERAMASDFDFLGGKSRIVLYLLCEKHEDSISEKAHRVPQQSRFV